MIDYRSKVKNHIIKPLGDMKMGDVTADDIRLAIIPASKMSVSVFKSVNVLYKCIFHSAFESKVIDKDPTVYLSPEGGGVPQKERVPLTDDQAEKLLQATKGLPPYLFVMLGLYAGLRREEILALKWDSVYLDSDAPFLTVRRAWHTENNKPVILTELKTNAAKRNIPLPPRLHEALREAKESSKSEYVFANSEGQPLSYTQFKRLWTYITTRTAKPRPAKKLVGGKYVKYTLYPKLGERARNNGKVVYSLDFEVTPHQLRHTYITNLIYSGVDPKTVQYLAGHENSKITMDIYAEQYERLMLRGHEPEVLLSYEATPGAAETINEWISCGHEVSIITGRPSSVYEPSRIWLDAHGLKNVGLYCLNKYGRDHFLKNSSSTLELEDYYRMKFDYAVEDSPKAFRFFEHLPELKVLVFDRPWNRACTFPNGNYQRCADWESIRRIVAGA